MQHSPLSQDNKDLTTVFETRECCCVNAFKVVVFGCDVFLISSQKMLSTNNHSSGRTNTKKKSNNYLIILYRQYNIHLINIIFSPRYMLLLKHALHVLQIHASYCITFCCAASLSISKSCAVF